MRLNLQKHGSSSRSAAHLAFKPHLSSSSEVEAEPRQAVEGGVRCGGVGVVWKEREEGSSSLHWTSSRPECWSEAQRGSRDVEVLRLQVKSTRTHTVMTTDVLLGKKFWQSTDLHFFFPFPFHPFLASCFYSLSVYQLMAKTNQSTTSFVEAQCRCCHYDSPEAQCAFTVS